MQWEWLVRLLPLLLLLAVVLLLLPLLPGQPQPRCQHPRGRLAAPGQAPLLGHRLRWRGWPAAAAAAVVAAVGAAGLAQAGQPLEHSHPPAAACGVRGG